MTDEEREILARAYAAIESVDEMNERLQERRAASAGREERQWPLPQHPVPRSARQRAPQRPVDGWRERIDQAIEQRLVAERKWFWAQLEKFAEGLGAESAAITKEERARIREQVETPLTELMMQLEHRIADLEARLKAAEERAEPRVRLIA